MMDIFGAAPDTALARSGDAPRSIEGASTSGSNPVRDQSRVDGEAAVEDNPWNGYAAPRQDPPTRVRRIGEERWFCPQHGPMCNPGICKARAHVERDERWKKEREEREEAKRRRNERRGRRGRRPEGREVPRSDQPARPTGGPREASRGSGSSSSSETRSEESEDSYDQGAKLIEQASEMTSI